MSAESSPSSSPGRTALVAGILLALTAFTANGVLVAGLLLRGRAGTEGAERAADLVLTVSAAATVAFGLVGAFLARRAAPSRTAAFQLWFTIVLAAMSGLLALGAATMVAVLILFSPGGSAPQDTAVSVYIAAICAFLALLVGVTAVLRAARRGPAVALTRAVAFLLLLWVPMGTAAVAFWYFLARKREPPFA